MNSVVQVMQPLHGTILRDTLPEKGCRPALVLLSGMPGSGKSSLADMLEYRLAEQNIRACVLDNDRAWVQQGLRDLFAPVQGRADRELETFMAAAKDLLHLGFLTILAGSANRWEDRLIIRQQFAELPLIEIYLRCDLAVANSRCQKRQYAGPQHPGAGPAYEESDAPELVVDTDMLSVEASAEKVLRFLSGRTILKPRCGTE